ncbi:MAG: hypothetical protein HY301_20785 [Verrucomicrobia bacterium]|nr:hypothetical protein [Verrucomicrobiota bacterium]
MHLLIAHPLIVLVVLIFGLSLPAAFGVTSLRRFSEALAASVFGVVLPLFVFFASPLLVVEFEWKGACSHGWVDGFHLGKLALAPLVLWATGAFYVVDVWRLRPPFSRLTVLGLVVGATVAGGCFLFGAVLLIGKGSMVLLWLLVPLYVAVWHAIRAWQLMRVSKPLGNSLLPAVLGTIPFWLGSLFWSHRFYESLPDNPPAGCFVATAASRGHRRLVGPFFEFARGGVSHCANQQLITLWKFEALWRARAPRSHAIFRRGYNRLGSVIARRITSPWVADLAFIALKPLEMVAALIVSQTGRDQTQLRRHSSATCRTKPGLKTTNHEHHD